MPRKRNAKKSRVVEEHQMATLRRCKDVKGAATERLGEDLPGGAEQRKGEEQNRDAWVRHGEVELRDATEVQSAASIKHERR